MIKDKIFAWYISNILLNKKELIDTKGFLITKFSKADISISLRELFLPENIFVEFEKKINEKISYAIGKKFGYYYSQSSFFPTLREEHENKISEFVDILIKYMEAIYADSIIHKIDYDKKIFSVKMKDYVICRKNGLGYLFSIGAIVGTWAWATTDKTVEAIQTKCQGRGDEECEVIAAPYKTLVNMGYKPIKCTDIEKIELGKGYEEFNKVRPTNWSKNSLKDLIDSGFFNYTHGQVTYKNERFFLCESSFMYILEKELKKVENGLKILWDVSFDFGKRLTEISGKQDPCNFITDFFPALGFGDILVVTKKGKYEIIANYFPWMEMYKEIDFIMFRGILSGVISGFTGKKVELNKIDKDISAGYLSLHITE